MPTLPILQMSGRGNAHHLGEPQPLPMTSMRTPVIPSESRHSGCSLSKSTGACTQSIDFTDFLPILR